MFDSLYPEAADTALAARARRAPEAPDLPWFKNGWRALSDALPRAGAEMGRAMGSLMTPEAVGAVSAPSMFDAPSAKTKPQLADEIRAQDRALASAIKELTPDPASTGVASQILHDVTRFVGKAAAYGALGGVPGSVAGMTLDEGTNEALRRIDEGVDSATAVKLGVTKGIASGVAVALPVAGRTMTETALLAAAGGPGAYITEQATARNILENANFLEEADKIDPFDPLGLGIAFLGPLAFGAGAHAIRGARGAHFEGNAPGASEQPLLDAQAGPPPEVDAAHVAVLQAQREGSALHASDDLLAAESHAQALDRASEQLAAGERVSVGDVAPADAARMVEAVGPVLERARAANDEAAGARQVETAAQPGATPEANAAAPEVPDVMVLMEGMDRPVKASDLLAEIKAMVDQEVADAPLLQVAAECALRG